MFSTLIAIAVSASLAGTPSDPGLQDGVKAYEEMDLDKAVDHLAVALRSSSSKERPRIELWLGIVELERGNDAVAKRWLRSALKAAPKLTVKQELSPKVIATIDTIRSQVQVGKKKPRRDDDDPGSPVVADAPPAATADAAPAVAAVPAWPPPAWPPVAPVAGASVAADARPTASAPLAVEAEPPVSAPPVSAPPVSASPASSTSSGPSSAWSSSWSGAEVAGDDAADHPPGDGAVSASPVLFAGAAAGAIAVAAVGGGAVMGVLASIGAVDAQNEATAALATKRYADATNAAAAANGLYLAGGVAAAVGVVCGAVWLGNEGEQ